MKLYISLNREEIIEQIPYSVVAETMSRSIWNTGKRKRLMKEYFTESEIVTANKLHRQAREWYLYKGVPDEIKMSPKTYELWQRLANFCCML